MLHQLLGLETVIVFTLPEKILWSLMDHSILGEEKRFVIVLHVKLKSTELLY